MTEEEILKILQSLEKAYGKAGRQIKTAVLHEGDTEKLVIDNRTEDELN